MSSCKDTCPESQVQLGLRPYGACDERTLCLGQRACMLLLVANSKDSIDAAARQPRKDRIQCGIRIQEPSANYPGGIYPSFQASGKAAQAAAAATTAAAVATATRTHQQHIQVGGFPLDELQRSPPPHSPPLHSPTRYDHV